MCSHWKNGGKWKKIAQIKGGMGSKVLLVATYLLHRKHQMVLFPFSIFPFSVFPFSVFPFSVFPFSVFPFSVFPFSGDKYKVLWERVLPCPTFSWGGGSHHYYKLTHKVFFCFLNCFIIIFPCQIFVKICVKLIITHPTNLHTRWLSQRCVFGFHIFSRLFCCQKSCQAYNHLLGRRR